MVYWLDGLTALPVIADNELLDIVLEAQVFLLNTERLPAAVRLVTGNLKNENVNCGWLLNESFFKEFLADTTFKYQNGKIDAWLNTAYMQCFDATPFISGLRCIKLNNINYNLEGAQLPSALQALNYLEPSFIIKFVKLARHTKKSANSWWESEELLVLIINQLPICLFGADKEGNLTFFQGAGYNSFHPSTLVKVGTNLFNEYALDPVLIRHLRKVYNGQTVTFKLDLTIDLAFETHYIPVFDAQGQQDGMIGIAINVAQYRNQTFEAKFDRNLLAEILDALPVYIFLKNREGKVELSNLFASQQFGFPPNSIVGLNNQELFGERVGTFSDAQDQRAWNGEDQHQLIKKVTINGHDKVIKSGRVLINTEDVAQNQYLLHFATDVTELVEAQEVATKQVKLVESILDSSPNIVFIKDYYGRLLFVNQAFANLLGGTKQDLIFQNNKLVGPNIPEPQRTYYESDRQVIATGRQIVVEEVIPIANGMLRRFQTIKSPFVMSGFGDCILCVGTDLTAIKEAEEKKEKALYQANVATAAKDTFLHNMSHEMRTPINGILGFAQLLKTTSLNPKQTVFVDTLTTSAGILGKLIDDILNLSKADANAIPLNLEAASLFALAESAVANLMPQALQKGISLSLITKDESVANAIVMVDPLRFVQILNNLVGNAVKFTQKGSVTIEIGSTSVPKEDTINFIIDVIDTGIGFPANLTDAIFDRFTQASDNITKEFGGTGLGLSISKQLAKKMGGVIAATSTEGLGSTFSLTLSLALVSITPTQTLKELDTYNLPSGLRILLVEDNIINQKLATHILTLWDANIILAVSGKEAIDILNQQKIDIVLLDINMPGLSGLDVCRHIRQIMPSPLNAIPIIAVTANASSEDADRYIGAGMQAVVGKPYNFNTLKKAIFNVVIAYGIHSHSFGLVSNTTQDYNPTIKSENEMKGNPTFKHIDLAYLEEFCGGDEDFIKEMMEIFVVRTNEDLPLLQNALNHGAHEDISQIVHKLKPNISFMGISSIADLVLSTEKLAREKGEIETIRIQSATIIDVAKQATSEVKLYLDQYLTE